MGGAVFSEALCGFYRVLCRVQDWQPGSCLLTSSQGASVVPGAGNRCHPQVPLLWIFSAICGSHSVPGFFPGLAHRVLPSGLQLLWIVLPRYLGQAVAPEPAPE